jgi:hypothetical protein
VDAAVNIHMLALIDTKLLVEVQIMFRDLMGRTNGLQQLTAAPLAKLVLFLAGQKKVPQFLELAVHHTFTKYQFLKQLKSILSFNISVKFLFLLSHTISDYAINTLIWSFRKKIHMYFTHDVQHVCRCCEICGGSEVS